MTTSNNKNDCSKRTALQVKSILSKNGIDCNVDNLGDNRTFFLNIVPTLQVRVLLSEIGFILCRTTEGDKTINVKCY
jgi:hypothetical protein